MSHKIFRSFFVLILIIGLIAIQTPQPARAAGTWYVSTTPGLGSMSFNLAQVDLPINDNFANAKTIASLPFVNSVDISNATIEPGEPQPCSSSPMTVWYSFTPTKDMLVRADTSGSSFYDTILDVYQAYGPGMNDLSFVQCTAYGGSVQFNIQAEVTYYLRAGSISGSGGSLQLNMQEIPRPANDDFAKAKAVTLPLPFDDSVDTQYSTLQTGEPIPSCVSYGSGTRSVWYAFTPATSGSISTSIPSSAFTPVFAAYTGSALNSLTQVGCQSYNGNLLTFHVNAGTTYYIQVGNLYPWDQGGSMQFHLNVTPQPIAGLSYFPSDPSTFDTIQFYDSSYDPGQLGFQSFTWNFGDGASTTVSYPTHKYAKDGDYTVQHSATTLDGRTASTTQVVRVRTKDVAISKFSVPQTVRSNTTKEITVAVTNRRYSDYVQVNLFKGLPGGGEQLIGTLTIFVPAQTNRSTLFKFSYTFTGGDAAIGKVTFRSEATIVNGRDALPADNNAIATTRVTGPTSYP